MKNRLTTFLAATIVAATLAACGAPWAIQAPDGMVEFNESRWSNYQWRASSVDGVVVGLRIIRQGKNRDVPRGDLDFWAEAVDLRLRSAGGYASLGTEDITSADGTSGRLLRFGRDQNSETFHYDVAVFVAPKFIHVLEVGGREDLYANHASAIQATLNTYRVRR